MRTDKAKRRRSAAAHGLARAFTTALAMILVALPFAAHPAKASATPTVSVSLSPPLIAANGSSTAVATAQVTDNGAPVAGESVSFASDGGQNFAVPTGKTGADGTYSTTVSATNTPGHFTITAEDLTVGVTGSATLTQYGPPASVVLALSSPSVPADGTSTVTATATVLDSAGDPVPGQVVSFSASPGQSGAPTIGPTRDNHDGTYSATITSGTQRGAFQITARDQSAARPTSSQSLQQVPPPPYHLALVLSRGSTASTTQVAVVVTDSTGNPVPGETIDLSTGNPADTASPASGLTDSDGIFLATVTLAPGPVSTITATDTTSNLTVTRPLCLPVKLAAYVLPGRVLADGTSNAAVAIVVTDAQGRGCTGEAPNLALSATDRGIRFSPIADRGKGAYAATLRSSKHAQGVAVKATDNADQLTAFALLDEIAGPPRSVQLTVTPKSIKADGISIAQVVILVRDAFGNPVSGNAVHLKSSFPKAHLSAVKNAGHGRYTAKVTSSATPGTMTLTATDTTPRKPISATARLIQTPAPSLVHTTTLHWSFRFTPGYTTIQRLQAQNAPFGGSLVFLCHGGGCPFAQRVMTLGKHSQCQKGTRCPPGTYDLTGVFANRRLAPGANITIRVLRRGWVGKDYAFNIRAGTAPLVRISCLAPGSTQPGAGCAA